MEEKGEFFTCLEEKGGLKDIHCSAQNAALFVYLLYNIFYNMFRRFYLILLIYIRQGRY